MRSLFYSLGIFWLVLGAAIMPVRGCGIDWHTPRNHFSGVNERGEFSIWKDIGKIDFGNGFTAPLAIGFKPNRGGQSCLGRGWIVPIMDANLVQVDDRKFMLTQPDGITRQFWRKKVTDSVLKGQGNWRGAINDNTITLWAECGWKLVFNKGKFTSFTTPKNRIFNVVYENGRAMALQEQGRTWLKVETDMSGTPTALTFGMTRIGIELGDKPRVEIINGVNVVGGMERSLHTLRFPDKSQTNYDFGTDDQLQPTLKISGDTSRFFTWNAATGRLLKEGDWSYDIKPAKDRWMNAAIGRTNGQNQKEFWFKDMLNGTETVTSLNGITKVSTFFTSGNITGKIRSITETKNGITRTISARSYDDMGRLMRNVNADGVIRMPQYDAKGHLVKNLYGLDNNPANVASRNKREAELTEKVASAPAGQEKDQALKELAFFYIHDLHTPEKAAPLATQISGGKQKFSVLLHLVDYDQKLSPQDKVKQLQLLLTQYPGRSNVLNALIKQAQKHHS